MPVDAGLLISIEGLDGAGKSTVVAAVAASHPDALVLREPGGTALSELLRAVLKHLPLPDVEPDDRRPCTVARELLKELKQGTWSEELRQVAQAILAGEEIGFTEIADPISPEEELLLFNAARAQLMDEVIGPALAAGRTVVLDRFLDSTVAYQGYGRGLRPDAVKSACLKATGGVGPDLTLYLRISPGTRIARITGRGEPDRIERSGEGFFERIVAGFDAMAAAEPDRFIVIDGEQSPAEVRDAALAAIAPHQSR